MPDWDSLIGSIGWDACKDCQHSDPQEGGCSVAERDLGLWEDALTVEHESVYCGSFTKRKEPEND